ncbi:type VII secretion protein [Streptococcus constellatus]|uniref:type VII secretion protein n=3 Tax=Streptococcus TaxID=1301 RepID=UPI001EFA94E1|nr:type VII secretion protein [Streptococcus constellatus]
MKVVMMDSYVNISLDFSPILKQQLDLHVPNAMTLKELVQIVSDAYGLSLSVVNPSARNQQTGEIISSTSSLEQLKNGVLLQLITL